MCRALVIPFAHVASLSLHAHTARFGTIYTKLGLSLAREGVQLSPWAMPGVAAAGWFLFPAMKHAGAFDAFLPSPPTGTVYKFEREELGEVRTIRPYPFAHGTPHPST